MRIQKTCFGEVNLYTFMVIKRFLNYRCYTFKPKVTNYEQNKTINNIISLLTLPAKIRRTSSLALWHAATTTSLYIAGLGNHELST